MLISVNKFSDNALVALYEIHDVKFSSLKNATAIREALKEEFVLSLNDITIRISPKSKTVNNVEVSIGRETFLYCSQKFLASDIGIFSRIEGILVLFLCGDFQGRLDTEISKYESHQESKTGYIEEISVGKNW